MLGAQRTPNREWIGEQTSTGPRLHDANRLIERWREGRSPQTLRAYSNDLRHFSYWLGGFLGELTLSTAQAVTILLTMLQGEANEIVRAYRSAMIERGLSTINRRLSALRSLVALGKELGFVIFDLTTRNVRACWFGPAGEKAESGCSSN